MIKYSKSVIPTGGKTMKKILMFLCCVFVFGAAHAGCNSPVTLSFSGNQDPDDNEFLYRTKDEFDKTVQGFQNARHNSGDGHGYECDQFNSGSCTTSDTVTLPAGHVFKGNVIDHNVTYICRTASSISGIYVEDKWEVLEEDDVCDTRGFGKVWVGNCVKDGSKCKELSKIDCSGYDKSDENGTVFNGICQAGPRFICKAIKCAEGFKVDSDGKCKIDNSNKNCKTSNGNYQNTGFVARIECEKNASTITGVLAANGALVSLDHVITGDVSKCSATCKVDGWDITLKDDGCQANYKPDAAKKKCEKIKEDKPTPNCRESRSTNIGKACCDIPSATYDARENVCTCKNGEKFEIYNTNHGRCVAGGIVPPVDPNPNPNPDFECPEIVYGYAYWRSQFADCPDVIATLDELQEYCAGKPSAEGYATRVAGLKNLGDACKDAADKKLRITKSTATINDAAKKLDDIMSGLKISVWKNKEGEFNTARLASDSIAGVVLGTAGGLITSHLVKKGQIKNGFEDIQCTVGGQKVADWGDEFTVGIQ